MKKIILSILSFLTISFFIFSGTSYAAKQTIAFKVDGVKDTTVSYSKKTAVVTFEDTKTDTTSLIQATTKAGYQASVIN